MKKGNVVDIIDYRCRVQTTKKAQTMSQELEKAIEQLIHRLRFLGPLPG